MKKLFFLFSLILVFVTQPIWAQDPIKIKGAAVDSKGIPLPNGEKVITFSVYKSLESATPLWSDRQNVTIKDGQFSVTLDIWNCFDLPLDKLYWLGMRIGDDKELLPRMQIFLDNKDINASSAKEIATGVATTLAANTLDEAYDGGGLGLGRTITADQGAVNIAGPDGLTVEGAIGIGTTNPTQLLEIRKNAIGVRMLVRNEGGGGGAGFEFIDDLSGANWKIKATQFGGFKIRDHANSLDVMGFDQNGRVGVGTLDPSTTFDVVGNTELNGDVDINSDLDVDGGTLHVDGANDRVGIGTTSPEENFHVIEMNSLDARVATFENSGGNVAAIKFKGASGNTSHIGTSISGFYISGGIIANQKDLVVQSSGNIGIGTTNPVEKLHIAGNIRLDAGGSVNFAGTTTSIAEIGGNLDIKANDILLEAEFEDVEIEANDDILLLPDDDLRIEASGVVRIEGSNVGISNTSLSNPTHLLHVNGVARSTQSTWATSSDSRVKTNIHSISGSLDKIQRLNPVTFEYIPTYRGDTETLAGTKMGFIAQEVQKIDPSMVDTVKETFGENSIEDFHILHTSNMIPMLVDGMKELADRNKILVICNEKLQTQILELKTRIVHIESALQKILTGKNLESEVATTGSE